MSTRTNTLELKEQLSAKTGTQELKKTLGFATAISTVVGMVIGSGVFFKPYAIYNATAGAPGVGILAWVVGGIITIAAGLTAAEVSAAIPKTGGMMVYLKEIYGEKWGFLTGWMQTVLYFPGMVAALAVIFGTQASGLLGLGVDNMTAKVGIAISAIVLLSFLNTLGSKTGGSIQTLATAGKLIPLVLIIIFGFIKGEGNPVMYPMVGEGVTIGTALGQALIAVLFAFEGWMNVGAIAGEMKNPGKDLPKAIVGGLSLVMAIYLVINIAYLWVMPANELMMTQTPAAAVATAIFGEIGGKLIAVGILISVFGALNGFILTGARMPYTLASEKMLPGSNWFSKLNNNLVPANATWFMAVLGSVYALSGKFDFLTDLTVFVIWLFFIMTFFGVIKLRKDQPNLVRPYKIPLYPMVPIIAIIGGSYVVINTLITQPKNAILGLIITFLGLPIYSYMKRNNA
jgi:basic amino acid/polyamine antiporter, APA family